MSEAPEWAIKDWEQIPPPPSSGAGAGGDAQSRSGRDWEVVDPAMPPPTFEDLASVFPPSRHEGLLVQPDAPPEPPPPQAKPGAPRTAPGMWVQVRKDFWKRLSLGFQLLYSKFLLLRVFDRARRIGRRAIWLSFGGCTVVGLAGMLWYIRARRRRRASDSGSLLLLVQDKDRRISLLVRQVAEMNEKISQLLHQIAEANDAISARCKVQVLRRA